jgi:hypothetical protein
MHRVARVCVGAVVIAIIVGAGVWVFGPQAPELQFVELKVPAHEEQAMCPWREPDADLNRYFPTATSHVTEVVILSPLRKPILDRIGKGVKLNYNAIYYYPIFAGNKPLGDILVNRVTGPHGGIEVVTALDSAGIIRGVRVQRHREPPEIAKALDSPRWFKSFIGKSAASSMEFGRDIPSPSPAAAQAAESITVELRTALIAFSMGKENSAVHHRVD